MAPDYALFASYGNDSIALIQWAYEHKLKNVTVVYSDTGWAAEGWNDRVTKGEVWVRSLGFDAVRIQSEGMLSLVTRKKAWPRGGGGKFQFCTEELKQKPALKWLNELDPEGNTICMIGVRREESANRATFPEWVEESEKNGGRSLHAPLVRHLECDRDALIYKTPFKPLYNRSKECYPCVNAKKRDIRKLTSEKLRIISDKEREMGINSKGNSVVMFAPRRHSGAVGIEAVYQWANGNQEDPVQPSGCDGGWCG